MWNLSFEGAPAAIRRSLNEYGKGLDGAPKAHFEEVCPVLDALVSLSKADSAIVLSAAGDGKSISVVMIKAGAIHVQ